MERTKILLCLFLMCFYYQSIAQDRVCFYMMNTEIKHTMEEDERQKKMRDGAIQNYSLEYVNKGEFKKLKDTTQKIRGRLSAVSLLVQSIPYGWNITKYIDETYEYQAKIWNEIADAPPFILAVLPQQISFAQQVQQNTLLVYGIVASYGAINQMEAKERKILLKFAEDEFETLYLQSMNIYSNIRTAKNAYQWKKQMLFASIMEDKRMFDEILAQF